MARDYYEVLGVERTIDAPGLKAAYRKLAPPGSISTTVMRGGQYIARKTDVYYLENADVPLFLRPLPPPPVYRPVPMKVVAQ